MHFTICRSPACLISTVPAASLDPAEASDGGSLARKPLIYFAFLLFIDYQDKETSEGEPTSRMGSGPSASYSYVLEATSNTSCLRCKITHLAELRLRVRSEGSTQMDSRSTASSSQHSMC